MIVKSQVKFWVFGAVGSVGIYYLTTALFGPQIGFGLTLIGAAIGAMILGVTWNVEKDGEAASTYQRQARDEEARQYMLTVMAKGAKQLEGPRQQAVE